MKTTKEVQNNRIVAIVQQNPGMNVGALIKHYKRDFGEVLRPKLSGYSKLSKVVRSIPGMEVEIRDDGAYCTYRGNESQLEYKMAVPQSPEGRLQNERRNLPPRQNKIEPETLDPESMSSWVPTMNLQEAVELKNVSAGSLKSDTDDTVASALDDESRNEKLKDYFSSGQTRAIQGFAKSSVLGSDVASFEECSLLGRLQNDEALKDTILEDGSPVFLNTHQPFCLATIGIQGAGKSHTLASILESCLLSFKAENISTLRKPMTALVLHYDQSPATVCEAVGLLATNPELNEFVKGTNMAEHSCVPSSKVTVLVSPSFYKQRKHFYGDYCTVRPLLFRWSSLTADHIKRIMGIKETDNQLYVASCMALLRKYQREGKVPSFDGFVGEISNICTTVGQSGPLKQRLALLESVVAESLLNQDITEESLDVFGACEDKFNLIVVDLTDPLLSKDEANGLFQVITEQFRTFPTPGGKLLALDEAHKFMDGVKSDGLSEAIINVARLMRHDGIRLVVSTQSPQALAPELLELVSVAVLHQFFSGDWWTYLQRKIPLPTETWSSILKLKPGDAIVFASRHCVGGLENPAVSNIFPVRIRPRLTCDFGSSRTNKE